MSSTGGNSATVSGSINSPRIDRSWATKVATGTGCEVGCQLTPRVVDGDDLRQRADREPAGIPVEHGARPLGRGEQCQPVLGERRRRPQLASGVASGGGAAVAQPEQPGPVVARAAGVDEPHETVEVDGVDQGVEWLVVTHRSTFRRVARGSGARSGRTGTRPTPPARWRGTGGR